VATILYGSILLDRDPDLGRRWMVAYLRGVRAYNDAFRKGEPALHAEAIGVLAAATRIAPELIEQIAAAGVCRRSIRTAG